MSNASVNLAVLFADVSGSTRLYEKLGDKRALECIDFCVNIMREVTLEHGGRTIKTMGDGLMCVFSTVVAAVQAAGDMQARVTMQELTGGQPQEIRIGLQFGPVLEKEGDVYGDSVNVAARMAGLAKAGQILTTSQFFDAMPLAMRALTRHLDKLPIKGKEEDIAICEIIWQLGEEMTNLATRMGSTARPQVGLLLRYGEKQVVVGPGQKQIAVGRDSVSDVVIADRKASRKHARIEWRRDKYVLIDQSSNGTYLTIYGQSEVRLRREDAVLTGRGSISFGHSYAADPTEAMMFEVGG
jgi:adenylate cyclase